MGRRHLPNARLDTNQRPKLIPLDRSEINFWIHNAANTSAILASNASSPLLFRCWRRSSIRLQSIHSLRHCQNASWTPSRPPSLEPFPRSLSSRSLRRWYGRLLRDSSPQRTRSDALLFLNAEQVQHCLQHGLCPHTDAIHIHVAVPSQLWTLAAKEKRVLCAVTA